MVLAWIWLDVALDGSARGRAAVARPPGAAARRALFLPLRAAENRRLAAGGRQPRPDLRRNARRGVLMASPRTVAWIERLIWTLIYGGMFTAVIGLATRSRDGTTGWSLIVLGAMVTAVGVVLIWVRSRLDKPLKHNGRQAQPLKDFTHDPYRFATLRPQGQDRPRDRRLARPRPADGARPRRSRRADHAHIAQGRRPGRGRGRAAGRRHRRALDRGRLREGRRDPPPCRRNAGAHG